MLCACFSPDRILTLWRLIRYSPIPVLPVASSPRSWSKAKGISADNVAISVETSPALLIIDDLGLRPLVGDEPLDLYEIIRCRYERGSMIITSNRVIDEWRRSSTTRCWPGR